MPVWVGAVDRKRSGPRVTSSVAVVTFGLSPSALLPPVLTGADRAAVRFPDGTLTYAQLRHLAVDLAKEIQDAERVAVFAEARLETVIGVVAALLACVPFIPINPKAGERELTHELTDASPDLILCGKDVSLPDAAQAVARRTVSTTADAADGSWEFDEPSAEAPAIILYTSGTTGPPKGVVLPRRSIATNLDGLAEAWQWTSADVLVHSLPLFHAHGLVLGLLGPLRLGGSLIHVGRFSSEAIAAELETDATMVFGVPTMYHRLAQDAAADERIGRALAAARLLISGSAPLSRGDITAIEATAQKQVLQRYGMSETLMLSACRADVPPAPGSVGPPVPSVSLRRVDETGAALSDLQRDIPGEIQVRGPNLFLEYLNRPEATEQAFSDGWFATGDIATEAPDGSIVLIGRASTDIIKSGGYKIGANEIESVLLDHELVLEAAVTGEPDADLGQRVVAWIVPAREKQSAQELIDFVARNLAPHKRPRAVYFLPELPRNHMGKVLKKDLSRSLEQA